MNLDDMKHEWQDEHAPLEADGAEVLASDVVARASGLERRIRRRDLIEIGAAVFVLAMFAFFQSSETYPPLMRAGMIVLMITMVEIAAVLTWTRRRDAVPPADLPVNEFCAAELVRVNRQIGMIRNAVWWYNVPIVLGTGLVLYGALRYCQDLPGWQYYGFMAGFAFALLATGVVLWRGQNHAIRTIFAPVRDDLMQLADSLAEPAEDP